MNARSIAALCAALLPWFVLPASAQQECKVRGLSLQPVVEGSEVHAHDEAGTATFGQVHIKSFLNHEFDTLKFKGPKLVFTAKADPASAKDPAELIGSCEIPANVKSVILLFVPEVAGQPASKILVVEDSAKAFPPGSVKVANLSSMTVKIELEKQPFEFKAGETGLIKDPPVGPNQSGGAKGFVEREAKWQLFYSGMWPHPGQKRVLQILVENPATKQVEIRGVRDVSKP
jgi:hypothetical protein